MRRDHSPSVVFPTVSSKLNEDSSKERTMFRDVVMNIYIMKLKMPLKRKMNGNGPAPAPMPTDLPVRIVWTKGNKNYKTQYKILRQETDTANFNEKF